MTNHQRGTYFQGASAVIQHDAERRIEGGPNQVPEAPRG